jgi:iron complex transport system ATP-binding protein
MSDILIQALGLGVELGGRRVIDGVSLTAFSGQVVAVVGPNGAGKTTLLRALAGLVASSGELSVTKGRTYCAQKPSCAWNYRVSDLGDIVGEPFGFADWLAKLGLAELGERRLTEISGGEQKCAHLAMALAVLPEPFGNLLLLDEPAASLDLTKQAAVHQAIRDCAQAGAACVIATHDLSFARRCDQVIVLSEGRLAAAGQPGTTLTREVIAAIWGEPALTEA